MVLILYALAGATVILSMSAIGYLVFTRKPYVFTKSLRDGNSSLVFRSRIQLASVILSSGEGKDTIEFVRKNIKGGETIEFVYPNASEKARLRVEAGSGSVQTFEV
jgi:hypothetical protein